MLRCNVALKKCSRHKINTPYTIHNWEAKIPFYVARTWLCCIWWSLITILASFLHQQGSLSIWSHIQTTHSVNSFNYEWNWLQNLMVFMKTLGVTCRSLFLIINSSKTVRSFNYVCRLTYSPILLIYDMIQCDNASHALL